MAIIKLIATDLDGTLCNANHCLDQTIAEYIKKLSARRIEWVLASGRAMEIVEPLFAKYAFRCPVIALNGALVYDREGKLTQRWPMKTRQAQAMLHEIQKQGVLAVASMENGVWCSDPQAYRQRMETLVRRLPDPALFAQEHGFLSLAAKPWEQLGACYKIEIYDSRPALADWARAAADFKVSVVHGDVIEMTDSVVSKAAALRQLCESRRLANEEVLCFGDSENDLEMLQEFRYGHIMRNAEEALLAQVNHIAPANTAYGVLRVIENYTGIPIGKEQA